MKVMTLLLVCLALAGCGRKDTLARSLSFDLLDTNGNYEFSELPFGISVSEIEKILDVTMEEPDYSNQGYDTYTLRDIYEYEGHPVQVSLEFLEDELQTVMFSFTAEADTAESLYSEMSQALHELYGSPDENINNEGVLPELNNSSFAAKGEKWNSLSEQKSTSLQLMLMTGDESKPSLTIGVGLLP